MEIVENYRHFCGYPGKRKRNRAGGYRRGKQSRCGSKEPEPKPEPEPEPEPGQEG